MAKVKTVIELEKDLTVIKGKYKMSNELIHQQQERRKNSINKAFELKSKEMLESLHEGVRVPVPYMARESTYTNKKGHVSKCYKSAYGRYAGTTPVILDYYIPYEKELFEFDFVKNKTLYKSKTFSVGTPDNIYKVYEY